MVAERIEPIAFLGRRRWHQALQQVMATGDEVQTNPPTLTGAERALDLLRVLILIASAFLLTSLGGAAAYAAPVTLPLLWWCAYTTKFKTTKFLLLLVAGLTGLEAGWIVAYVTVGERWAVPAGFALAALIIVFFGMTTFRKREVRPSQRA